MSGGDPMQVRNEKLEKIAQLAEDIAARARAIPMDKPSGFVREMLDEVTLDLQSVLQDLDNLTEEDYRD
jgi:division protein CdvB (Snf7/Vps24/ESCRT-III family)